MKTTPLIFNLLLLLIGSSIHGQNQDFKINFVFQEIQGFIQTVPTEISKEPLDMGPMLASIFKAAGKNTQEKVAPAFKNEADAHIYGIKNDPKTLQIPQELAMELLNGGRPAKKALNQFQSFKVETQQKLLELGVQSDLKTFIGAVNKVKRFLGSSMNQGQYTVYKQPHIKEMK